MRYRCLSCGAPLEIEPEVTLVSCEYCNSTSRREAGTRDHGKAVVQAKLWGVAAAAISITTLAFVLLADRGREAPEPVAARPAPAPGAERPAPAPTTARSPPEPAKPARVEKSAAPEAPARQIDPGDIMDKSAAKQVLEPALLACMKDEDVHSLIIRLGQGYEGKSTGLPGPLVFVKDSWVDYRVVGDFGDTPLGRCILTAAAEVVTDARRGNYIYFGIDNPDAPDPLEGAPERLPVKEAGAALSAFDGEARECARRFVDSAPHGKTVSLEVEFLGVDGSVRRVRVFHQSADSPHTRCLVEVYAQARSPLFRGLTGKATHRLTP